MSINNYTPISEECKTNVEKSSQPNTLCAAELAALIGSKSRFAQDAGRHLYVFDNGVYAQHGDEFVKRRVWELLKQYRMERGWTSRKANETIECLRVQAPELWSQPPTDRISLANGLFNVKERTLAQHSHDFLWPVQIPVAYDAKATCPAWETQIVQTFPSDAVEAGVAWQVLAALMVPIPLQKALMLVGAGGNGKSVFLNAVTAFLGKTNVSTVPLQKLENDRFACATVFGRLANICADLSSASLRTTNTFKLITGGDEIYAERKQEHPFCFYPFCKLVFAANTIPTCREADEAYFDRWIILPFDRRFRGAKGERRSDELFRELTSPQELSGALNRALEYLPHVLKNGITVTESMQDKLLTLRQNANPVEFWLKECAKIGWEWCTATKALHDSYTSYAKANNQPPFSIGIFAKEVNRLCPDLIRRQLGKGKVPHYVGIGLIEDEDQLLAA
jgi:putative DNA primase/helicase